MYFGKIVREGLAQLGKNKIARVVKNTNECGFNRWPIN
jgi:hypothetical protein